MKKRLAATSLSKSLKPALPATKKFNQPSGFAGDYILLQSWGNVNFPKKLVRPSPVTIKKVIENQAPLHHSEVGLWTKESMTKWKWVQDETKNTPCLKIKEVKNIPRRVYYGQDLSIFEISGKRGGASFGCNVSFCDAEQCKRNWSHKER